MRLLKLDADCSFSLVLFSRDELPPYAILSHTWGQGQDEEVTFTDLVDNAGRNKKGFRKLQFCAKQTKADGLHYFWVDTCCIDKSNNNELTTAINSMFRWYQNAARCYVYLTDVSFYLQDRKIRNADWELAFRKSRWFTRGWTLQELLAPERVEFYSQDRKYLGSKASLQRIIYEITGISINALQGCHLSGFSVDNILKWKESRQTTEEEDMAYCLLGIFDISMSLIYGEGYERAMERLLRKVAKSGRTRSQQSVNTRIWSYRSNIYQRLKFIPGVSTLATFLQAESNLWRVFVAISCCTSFYWAVVSISFCLTRLLHRNLTRLSASSQTATSLWRDSTVSKRLSGMITWYCFLVAMTWCSALTPLHILTPAYLDIWKPYMDLLPSQLSKSLVGLPLQDGFLMQFGTFYLFTSGIATVRPIFVVPKPRNKTFVQRASVMSLIEKKLSDKSRRLDARVVLYGLGGIGKTQRALEYSYRAREQGVYDYIFWISGEPKHFVEGYYRIASKVNLTVSRSDEQQSMEAVQDWLESNGGRSKPWLLVIDGLDDVDASIFQFLPKHGGQIILTGRSEDLVTRFADPSDGIHLDKMEHTEAKELFEMVALVPTAQFSQEVDYLLQELERLPLAILQAAMFIRQIKRTQRQPVLWYLEQFRNSVAGQQELLSKYRKTMYIDSDTSSGVMTTWKITFDYLTSEHPKTIELFKMIVYLSPIQIPAHLFHVQISSQLEDEVKTIAAQELPSLLFNKVDVQEALGTLAAFSFLSYSFDEQHFDIHRLVRLTMLAELVHTSEVQPFTQISLVMALAFPEPELSNVVECSRLYAHVEEILSSRNMAATKEPMSMSLRLNLLLRSLSYLRLNGRKDEALQLVGRIYEEKKILLGGVCSHVTSQYNARLLHAASQVCNDLEEYGPAKELGELEYQMLENAYGELDPRTLQSLNHLAWIETLPQGDHQKAKYTFEKVIGRTESPQLGTINAEAKRGLAMLLRDMKQILQAYQVMSEAVETTREMYGEQSVEFALCLTDFADFQWRHDINQKREAGANQARALPILRKHLGPSHPKVLSTAYKVAVFIIHFDETQLAYAELLLRELVQTRAGLILQADMDPSEMLDGLATALWLKGTQEALEEAVCLTRAAVAGFTRQHGSDHPRTREAQSDLVRIEAGWQKAINGRGRKPRESRWLQALRGKGSYDPLRTC